MEDPFRVRASTSLPRSFVSRDWNHKSSLWFRETCPRRRQARCQQDRDRRRLWRRGGSSPRINGDRNTRPSLDLSNRITKVTIHSAHFAFPNVFRLDYASVYRKRRLIYSLFYHQLVSDKFRIFFFYNSEIYSISLT